MAGKTFRRKSRQRQVILDEIQRLSSHPSAAELYEIVRRRLPRISLGTVYRNLELLAQSGVIRKLESGGSEARFDGNVEPHYHVRCVRCGRVDDAPGLPGDLLKDEIRDLGGYKVIGYRLELAGICPACRSKPTPNHNNAAPHRVNRA